MKRGKAITISVALLVVVVVVVGALCGVGGYYAGLRAASPVVTPTVTAPATVTVTVPLTPAQPPTTSPAPATPSAYCPDKILIGWPVPITGPLAPFGEPAYFVKELVEGLVNKRMGGVYLRDCGKRAPIEIIILDTTSSDTRTAEVTAELITKYGVHLIVTLHTPQTTVPASLQCERFRVPCISTEAPADAWLEMGAPYYWSRHAFWTLVDLANVFVGIWDRLAERGKIVERSVAILYELDPEGEKFKEILAGVLTRRGYKITHVIPVAIGTTDFTPIILELKRADVEIVTGMLIPPDFVTLRRQMAELGYTPKAITMAKAYLFPSAVEALGPELGNGLTIEIWAHPVMPYRDEVFGLSNRDLANMWEERTGRPWTASLMYEYMAFVRAIDVLQRAGSVNPEAIRRADAETDLITNLGRVCFKCTLDDYYGPHASEMRRLFEELSPVVLRYKESISIMPLLGGQWIYRDGRWHLEVVYSYLYEEVPLTMGEVLTIEEALQRLAS